MTGLRYQPTSHGEMYPDFPPCYLSEEWLAERAAELGQSVAQVRQAARALRRTDGRPLYAPAEAPEPPAGAPPPSEPLGSKPPGN
jgi:hypothetical protein